VGNACDFCEMNQKLKDVFAGVPEFARDDMFQRILIFIYGTVDWLRAGKGDFRNHVDKVTRKYAEKRSSFLVHLGEKACLGGTDLQSFVKTCSEDLVKELQMYDLPPSTTSSRQKRKSEVYPSPARAECSSKRRRTVCTGAIVMSVLLSLFAYYSLFLALILTFRLLLVGSCA